MALPVSQRKNVARQIVGEVRGPEAWLMIKAMESGSGSLSTTHAASAADATPSAGGPLGAVVVSGSVYAVTGITDEERMKIAGWFEGR